MTNLSRSPVIFLLLVLISLVQISHASQQNIDKLFRISSLRRKHITPTKLLPSAFILRGGESKIPISKTHYQKISINRVHIAWPLLSAWLYFLACAFTIPAIPKLINQLIGKGQVTSKSASFYGLVASTDAFFTFLTTNFHATMSDTYGRKPFMMISMAGLGIGFLLTMLGGSMWVLLLAAAIDGCTSCMYSIAQAAVTDCVGDGPKLSESLGLFQGLSIGMAFTIGMPLGGFLVAKKGSRYNLSLSAALCGLNLLVTGLFMPESLAVENRKKKPDILLANPFGALRLIARSGLTLGISICFSLLWIANTGLQVNFFNYTDKKFQWSAGQSGAGLALMGVMIAAAPKVIIPYLGLKKSLIFCLTVYSVAQVLIGAAPSENSALWMYTGLALSAMGSVAFPTMLALLNQQADPNEAGAVQGAADTVKTATTVCANPMMAACFGYFISEKAPKGLLGGSYFVGAGVALLAAIIAMYTVSSYNHLIED